MIAVLGSLYGNGQTVGLDSTQFGHQLKSSHTVSAIDRLV